MFEITKILNHNAILVIKDQREYLILDKGIGFGKKVKDQIKNASFEAVYQLQSETKRGNKEIIEKIDPIFLEVAHQILKHASEKLGNLDHNILLPLSDHIAFAIERIKNGLIISNPFTNEIRMLNPDEYKIASIAKSIIQNRLGYEINEDEIGYITLHLHSAATHEKVDESMKIAMIVQESIKTIEEKLSTSINIHSLAYSRLLTHMKYMLARIKTNEKLNLDMDEYVRTHFPLAYEAAEAIIIQIGKELHRTIPRIEIGYLGLHIQRICDITKE